MPETLPNITGGFYSNALLEGSSGAFYDGNNPWGSTSNSSSKNNQMTFNASRSSSAYQDGAAVQQRAVEMFLYFFAGNAVKSDTIIDTGKITEALNAKLDIDMDNLPLSGKSLLCGLGMPSERIITLTANENAAKYTAPANGWFFFASYATAPQGVVTLVNESTFLYTTVTAGNQGNPFLRTYIPARKGDIIRIEYGAVNLLQYTVLQFNYAEGENE